MALPSGLVYPYPPYLGFTEADMETELTNYKTAVKAFNAALSAASINGQSFQFAALEKQRAELDSRGAAIREAIDFLNPGYFQGAPLSDASLATLR